MTKEELGSILFELCNDKSKNTKAIVQSFIDKIGYDKILNRSCVEMEIQKYRQRGRGLEEAALNIMLHITCDDNCLLDDCYDFKP